MPKANDRPKKQTPKQRPAKLGSAIEPECLSADDAIAAVRRCLQKIAGGGDNIQLDAKISDALPGDSDNIGLRRLLACIRKNTGFDLDPDQLADGTFQDIADKITCD